ncbi:hypothetical protein [Paenibacillus sp. L3-i20]|uniref:hypothetical protein n=1 Tax=Paenibacillus sp. L3-i20 TaxID=2905833 RepID=UPI0020BFE520|nr:hypothetical protein [Paenibacillus sp. L3-i20]
MKYSYALIVRLREQVEPYQLSLDEVKTNASCLLGEIEEYFLILNVSLIGIHIISNRKKTYLQTTCL